MHEWVINVLAPYVLSIREEIAQTNAPCVLVVDNMTTHGNDELMKTRKFFFHFILSLSVTLLHYCVYNTILKKKIGISWVLFGVIIMYHC